MLTPADLSQLDARGLTRDEAERQIQLLRHRPAPTRLVRPCTIGDGIARLHDADHARLLSRADEAASAGRITKFVPASGAATRMFKDLLDAMASTAPPSATPAGREFFDQLHRFPFAGELKRRSGIDHPRNAEEERRLLHTLLEEMRYADLPKALIAFHCVHGVSRTAFEEHLLEATQYARAHDGVTSVHFTVAPEFLDEFGRLLEQTRPSIEERTSARLNVSFSVQHPSTDTLAITPEGEPFRQDDGTLLFRPSGHGALLRNLQDLNADLVVIKNIDNVLPFEISDEVVHWKRLLIGYLLTVLDEAPADRPARVCGVVKNEGEPGGAPFWVVARDGGHSAQVVESSQVDLDDADQRRIFESSTHFNPVDIVCALRDREGRRFDLSAFVDPSAVFVAKKSHQGRDLVALERPGLWNGAMAGWHTVFVEVPASTFAPVKTVFDLLRPQHQSL